MNQKAAFLVYSGLMIGWLVTGCALPMNQFKIPTITAVPTPFVIASPTLPPAETPTLIPTPTASPIPTITEQPVTLTGRLFFDMDVSGTQNEIQMKYYDGLIHPKNKNQVQNLDFVKNLEQYIQSHPNTKDGTRITILEPGLSNYAVCAFISDIPAGCALTDSQGDFSLSGSGIRKGDPVGLSIIDKNVDKTATMRYQNRFVKSVIIPAYTMNARQVPEQRLTQTHIMKISNRFYITASEEKVIRGLLQGFMPYQIIRGEPYIYSFFDHDLRKGYGLDWRNRTGLIPRTYNQIPNKMTDNLDGIDIGGQKGDFVLSAGFGMATVKESEKYGKQVVVMIDNIPHLLTYSHLDTVLVADMQEVFTGQIIGIIGRSGKDVGAPHVHLDVGSSGVDPFGDPLGKYEQVWTRAFSSAEFP